YRSNTRNLKMGEAPASLLVQGGAFPGDHTSVASWRSVIAMSRSTWEVRRPWLFCVVFEVRHDLFRTTVFILDHVTVADLSNTFQDDVIRHVETCFEHKNVILFVLDFDLPLTDHAIVADHISIFLCQNL